MLFRRIHIKQYYSLIKYDQLDSFEIKYGKRKVDIFMAKNEIFQIKPIQGDYAPTSNTLS